MFSHNTLPPLKMPKDLTLAFYGVLYNLILQFNKVYKNPLFWEKVLIVGFWFTARE